MTRSLMTACLAAAIAGILADISCAENIQLTFKQIKFEYVEEDPGGGITFGGGSAFPPLPADFFDPGSLPFDGIIRLQSAAGDTAMTVIRKIGGVFPDPPAPVDIPIEIVSLNLVSAEPIIVNYSGGATEQWDVTVNLNPRETSDGAFRILHNGPGEPDGGAILPMDSFFDLSAEVGFSRGPRHRFFAIVDRTNLSNLSKWAHQNDNIAGGADREFIPGADPANPSAPPQILFFDGGGLDLPLRVIDVVPEPSSLVLVVLSAGWILCGGRRRDGSLEAGANYRSVSQARPKSIRPVYWY